MKTLYLVRHAKSDWENENISDINRPLNERGYKDAHAMSLKLKEVIATPEVFISSPAIRAITTCLIFAGHFNVDPKKINIESTLYETPLKEYLKIIQSLDKKYQTAILFAHNPTITELCNTLTKPFTDGMPTCGIAGITFNLDKWEDIKKKSGDLELYDFPKNQER
jgi:phosphohistidine phosphatase